MWPLFYVLRFFFKIHKRVTFYVFCVVAYVVQLVNASTQTDCSSVDSQLA